MLFTNYPLKNHNTFGLDYRSDYFLTIENETVALEIIQNTGKLKMPLLIMGGGSNLLFTEDFRGTILYPDIRGIDIEEQNSEYAVVSAGAGEKWDDFVDWCTKMGFGGVENLSLIPGNCGAVPVQNIGAYGVEVKDVIIKTRGISITEGTIQEFDNANCRFGYRTSIFKSELKGKFLVTRVFFRLKKNPEFNLTYGYLKDETVRLGGLTAANIRQAVINIRESKLPDPKQTGNAGSFFKNPVVDSSLAEKLLSEYPSIPVYDDPSGGKKLAAGWLIEKCGWKGKRWGNAGIHDKQALVLINHGSSTGREIYELSEKVRNSVRENFGIDLEREVEIVGSI
jgi:UDP-N-acetylmuramate dehydrogenase